MGVLEQARAVYAKVKSLRNGHAGNGAGVPCTYEGNEVSTSDGGESREQSYEINEGNEVRVSRALVADPSQLAPVLQALDESARVGLDTETTGLDPRTGRVRLLSLATDRGTYLVDCFALDPAPLFDALAQSALIIHNASFDIGFLWRLGMRPGAVHDTMMLARLLTAGTYTSCDLAACAERELGRALDKRERRSDWSGELTREQLDYAALDVEVLPGLYSALAIKAKQAGLAAVAEIERRCLPALLWMADAGVALDRRAWEVLAQTAGKEAARLAEELDALAPSDPEALCGMTRWNWDSPVQVGKALELAGCQVADTADETLAAVDHPLANLLRQYRAARKQATTYGTDWLSHVAEDGRVYPTWKQLGAASGRMSCSEPNMQQLPRGDYRRCVVAPPGRVLVKADYSQIELRIAAQIAGDRAMLDAYRQGADLHALTAQRVLGIGEVTKDHRQLAKALNFGLLYGMGYRGFRIYARSNYGLALSEDEARRYRDAFFTAYPGLAAWHRKVRSRKTTETRTLTGRRRLLDDKTPDTHRLNTPVQGTGADGLKQALALLWERREEVPGAVPVLAVHDEIVVECDQGQAGVVSAWLRQAMLDGFADWLDPVPVEVEVKTVPTWGG